jgi:DNA mismatch repair ATPase MutS
MGARRLRHWVLHPLRDLDALIERQDVIASFLDESMLLSQVRTLLKEVRDLERTSGRLSQGSGNARDLLAARAVPRSGAAPAHALANPHRARPSAPSATASVCPPASSGPPA